MWRSEWRGRGRVRDFKRLTREIVSNLTIGHGGGSWWINSAVVPTIKYREFVSASKDGTEMQVSNPSTQETDQTLGSTLCIFSRGSQLRIIIDRLPPRDKDKQTMNSSAQQCVERLWEDKWMESDNGWTWHPSVRFGEIWSVAMEQSLPIYWLWRFEHGTANYIACNWSELFTFRKQIPSAGANCDYSLNKDNSLRARNS